MKTSPTQLTLKKLRKDGWPFVRVVEKWCPFAKRRIDLFGFDVLAINGDRQVWVQCTSAANVSARLKKLTELDTTAQLRSSPFVKCLVWGWAKVNGRYQLKKEVEL